MVSELLDKAGNYRFLGEFKGGEAPQGKNWGIYKPKA
jgi:hypothetical protein